jgi:predicted MPP superfamily phosphohydrolase
MTVSAVVVGALLVGLAVYGYLESRWIRVRSFRLSRQPRLKIAHISDIHHRGDRAYLLRALALTAGLEPDLLCVTGDLVEHRRHADAVMEALGGFSAPVYVVPGNWDNWAGLDLARLDAACQRTGGGLLRNRSSRFDARLSVIGIDDSIEGEPDVQAAFAGVDTPLLLFLCHCPMDIELLDGRRVTLALAGHSHGGQVRLPMLGAPIHRPGMGPYDRGLFRTRAGPLHVNPGLGTWRVPLRLLCRPEITLIEL